VHDQMNLNRREGACREVTLNIKPVMMRVVNWESRKCCRTKMTIDGTG
jgi:hypothetical protein